MNKIIDIGEIVPLMKEQMDNNGKVRFTPKGNSMLPLLRNNMDVVTMSKPEFPLAKYSIAFYQRKNGQYVLHRVVKRKDNKYTMRGDNQLTNEPGITEEQIIAYVTSFERKGKQYNISDKKYKIYCFLWVHSVWVRKLYKISRRMAGKVKRKILRKSK